MAPIAEPTVFAPMKTTHALNFFLIGLSMCFSPAYWPELFSRSAVGNDSSELWLLIMGMTQMAMGAWTMGLNLVPRLLHIIAEWEPVTLDFSLPDVTWALPESFYTGLQDDEDIHTALRLQQQLRLGRA